MTGGRIKRAGEHVDGETFCLTYGDGVSDINIRSVIDFHKNHGYSAAVSAVYPPKRFGQIELSGDQVQSFKEEPDGEGGLINGGFFVLSPKVIDYIDNDETIWEREPLQQIASAGQLRAYRHQGFFQPMDTLRDKIYLEDLWQSGKAPWKTWRE